MVNQGVGAGLGSVASSVACSISCTSRRKSIKIKILLSGQHYHCHPPIIADGPCSHFFGLRTC